MRFLSPVVFDRLSAHFMADNGTGSGGGGHEDDDDDLQDPPAPAATGNAAADALLRSQFDQSRDWLRAQRKVLARNRTRATEAERTLTAERQEREGTVVLKGDDLALYEAYKGLGKPDELATKLAERDSLATEVATAKRDATIREVAEVAGLKPTVLKRLGGDLDYVIKEITQDGKAVKAAYVATAQGERPIGDYVDEQWADFKESLTAPAGGGQRQQGGGNGVPFPAQRPGNGTPPANPAAAYLASAYKGPPSRGG